MLIVDFQSSSVIIKQSKWSMVTTFLTQYLGDVWKSFGKFKLLLSGDVQENPGPAMVIHVNFMEIDKNIWV